MQLQPGQRAAKIPSEVQATEDSKCAGDMNAEKIHNPQLVLFTYYRTDTIILQVVLLTRLVLSRVLGEIVISQRRAS